MPFVVLCFPFEELPLTPAIIVSYSNNVNFLNICKVIFRVFKEKNAMQNDFMHDNYEKPTH